MQTIAAFAIAVFGERISPISAESMWHAAISIFTASIADISSEFT